MTDDPNNITCPECDGDKMVECPHCGSEEDCDLCEGTGFDPLKVDLPSWKKAEEEFQRTHGMTCGLYELGVYKGRQTLDGSDSLLIEVFLIKERETQ